MKRILNSETFKQSVISFSGTIISGVLGAIFYIVVARELGPQSFGSVSVSIAFLSLVASVFNFGTDTGVVKFVAADFKKNREKSLKYLKLALKIKLLIGALILVLGYFTSPYISQYVFNKPEITPLLRIAIIGSFATMLFSLGTSSLQSISKFFMWSLTLVGSNLFRLIAVFLIIIFGSANPINILWSYIVVLFVWFFITQLFIPSYIYQKGEQRLLKDFLKYNKWVALFTIVAAFSGKVDTFLITRNLSLVEVGIYSVGVTLAGFVSQIVLAFGSVIGPKLASMERANLLTYFRKIQWFASAMAIGGVAIGIPIGILGIPFLYGPEYSGSIAPFAILLVSQGVFLLSTPVHSTIIYHFANPKLFVYVTAGNLLVVFVSGSLLLPHYGYIGMATSVLIGTVFNFIAPSIWLYLNFQKK